MSRNPATESSFPITRELALCGYTITTAAEAMGVTYGHLRHVGRGITRPSPNVVKGFKKLTGKSIRPFLTEIQRDGAYDPAVRNRNAR